MTSPRTNFELRDTVEAFYTGGDIQLSNDDGSCLYCLCGDRVNEIDVTTGRVKGKFQDDDSDEITSFLVSPDNKILITASKSLLIHKFEVTDRKCIDRWKSTHKTPILTMAFDQSATLISTGSSDSSIKVYDTTKKYYTHNFKGASSVSILKFHPDTSRLVLFSAYIDGSIRIWDLKSSKCLSILEGHFSVVTSLQFLSDHAMVSASRDKVLIVWDLQQRKQLKTIPVYECLEDLVIISSADGEKQLVSVGESGSLKNWCLPDLKCIGGNKKKSDTSNTFSEPLTHIFYTQTLDQFISVTINHNIIFYNTSSLQSVKHLIGYYDDIVDLKLFGADQEYLAVASNSQQVKVLNIKDGSSEIINGHSDTILSLDISYDDKYIVASSKDNTLSVWMKDLDVGKFICIAKGKGHTHHVECVAWPKSSTDYVISCSKDLSVKCWILPQMIEKEEVVDLSVKWTQKAHDKSINVISVSPNDKLLVSASQDKTAKLWKMKSGKSVGELRGHKRGIWCAVFSPVDQCIATGSVDGTIKLWALSTLICVKTFEGHTNSVLRVYFFNKGMQLVSSGSEGLLKVWSIRDDECVATVEGHDDKVWALAVSKTEDIVVSGGSDSCIKFWYDNTEQVVTQQRKEDEEKVLKEQEMKNMIHMKQYDKAVELAIMLNHPQKALFVFKKIIDEENAESILQNVISRLNINNLEALLWYICEWNTNGKNSFVSQYILSIILKTRLSDDLLNMNKMKEVIESLLPYTERHFDRVNKLFHQSMFVNYSWETMKLPLL